MPAHTYDDEVFREKRKPKNPITFKLKLNEEQKLAKDVILTNTITLFLFILQKCSQSIENMKLIYSLKCFHPG